MECKKIISGLLFCLAISLAGCQESPTKEKTRKQEITADSRKIAGSYDYIIRQIKTEKEIDTFKMQQNIIACLGAAGHVAVDIDNQIDMVNWEKAERFCRAAKAGQAAEVTLLLVMDNGGFVRYDLESEDSEINVLVSSVFPEDEKKKESNEEPDYFEEYIASSWKYTEKGYLFLEQYHMSGFDGSPGQTAIRIKPLDETCRKLNRQYVLPVGYRGNELLIADWDEKDYTALDFYDLYEVMYMVKYGKDLPWPDEYTGVEYEVPEKEFEGTIKTYLNVDDSVIQRSAVYHEDTRTYRYRARGLYDSPEPYEPLPEVTAYEKMEDGTIKLTVEAVWAMKKEDSAITSELIVRPCKSGYFQYVSNHVTAVSDSLERMWYTPRLTDEEWERLEQ